jgi:hypothetical protein
MEGKGRGIERWPTCAYKSRKRKGRKEKLRIADRHFHSSLFPRKGSYKTIFPVVQLLKWERASKVKHSASSLNTAPATHSISHQELKQRPKAFFL